VMRQWVEWPGTESPGTRAAADLAYDYLSHPSGDVDCGATTFSSTEDSRLPFHLMS
jgi:hypothetical protein